MTLVATGGLVAAAAGSGAGLAAFNVLTLEHAEAVVQGAAAAGRPVLLQVSQNAVRYHGAPEPLLAACREIAAAAAGPVGLHLDHLDDPDLVQRLLVRADDLGVGSLMFDASALDHEANVARTTAVAQAAHAQGLWVEAELGAIGGKGGAHAPGVRTDPAEAADFVVRTRVDGLAVAVGSSHAMRERTATLDLELIRRLAEAVPVPLVLHGSSGVPDDTLRAAVVAGIRKVNVGTALNLTGTEALRRTLAADPDLVDPRAYGKPVRAAMAVTVEHLCRVLTAAP